MLPFLLHAGETAGIGERFRGRGQVSEPPAIEPLPRRR
jgi:hypothetical protein